MLEKNVQQSLPVIVDTSKDLRFSSTVGAGDVDLTFVFRRMAANTPSDFSLAEVQKKDRGKVIPLQLSRYARLQRC